MSEPLKDPQVPSRPMTQPEGFSGGNDPPEPVDSRTPESEIKVSMGGPRPLKHDHPSRFKGAGWNAGDIDFRDDGTIFIRNPYLADAIEEFLRDNWLKHQKDPNHHFLKIVRDEGWSGHPTNVVC